MKPRSKAVRSTRGRSRGAASRVTSPKRQARPARAGTRAKAASARTSARRAAPAGRKTGAKSAAAKPGGRTAASATKTTDHDEIREFVESRGGAPATVRGTRRGGEPAGLLRIDFPGYTGEETLKHIDWDEWFDKFEEKKLAALIQEKTGKGDPSRFFKLVKR